MKRDIDNCGGKWSFINPPEFIFTASCKIHDTNYFIGWKEKDRKRADDGFLKYMLIDCNRHKGLVKKYYIFWAYCYYYSVRVFWKKYFNYN